MLKLTNPQDAFKFTAFLDIALPWVGLNTPTNIDSGGTAYFAQMFSDKLIEEGVKHKIWAVLFHPPGSKSGGNNDRFRDFMAEGDIEILKKSCPSLVVIDIGGNLYDCDGNMTSKIFIRSKFKKDPVEMIRIKRETLDLIAEHCDFTEVYDKETMPLTRKLLDEAF